jgi:hypothetical protein
VKRRSARLAGSLAAVSLAIRARHDQIGGNRPPVRRARLFVFLRVHRQELSDEQFQTELAAA